MEPLSLNIPMLNWNLSKKLFSGRGSTADVSQTPRGRSTQQSSDDADAFITCKIPTFVPHDESHSNVNLPKLYYVCSFIACKMSFVPHDEWHSDVNLPKLYYICSFIGYIHILAIHPNFTECSQLASQFTQTLSRALFSELLKTM